MVTAGPSWPRRQRMVAQDAGRRSSSWSGWPPAPAARGPTARRSPAPARPPPPARLAGHGRGAAPRPRPRIDRPGRRGATARVTVAPRRCRETSGRRPRPPTRRRQGQRGRAIATQPVTATGPRRAYAVTGAAAPPGRRGRPRSRSRPRPPTPGVRRRGERAEARRSARLGSPGGGAAASAPLGAATAPGGGARREPESGAAGLPDAVDADRGRDPPARRPPGRRSGPGVGPRGRHVRRHRLLPARRAASSSSGVMSTARAFDPSEGPTTPRRSRRSISRPAREKPTRSLRCSIDVDPS